MNAELLYTEAEKRVKKIFFKDYEGAHELFRKAGDSFMGNEKYARAGEAYMHAGECALKEKDFFSAGKSFADSVKAYKRVDLKKAGEMLDISVGFYIDTNQLGTAAELLSEFADALVEKGLQMEAIPYYEKAMRYFNVQNQKMRSQKCMNAMAKIYGENDEFEKALQYYESIANDMLSGPLKFHARDYHVQAMFCRLAMVINDNRHEKMAECREALKHYLINDIHIRNTREHEFLVILMEALEDCNMEKFYTATSMLNDQGKLDDWKTHVLLVMRNNMESLA